MAVRWGYLDKNPCDVVSKPKVPAPEIRPFSKEEAKRFIAAASGERYEALFVLGLTSGARWGELAGLQWGDLNLDSKVMHIQRALVNGYGGHSFDTPKTSGSRRSVGLTVKATEALVGHRDRMRDEGHSVSGNALVFVNTLGKPLHSSNFIRRYFKPLLRRAGLPDTNWHAATRHSCTCILLLEGVNPKSVAMQNGLPFRADFHRLFDNGLVTVDDGYRVVLSDQLKSEAYAAYDGRQLLMPHELSNRPSKEALKVHRGLVFRA